MVLYPQMVNVWNPMHTTTRFCALIPHPRPPDTAATGGEGVLARGGLNLDSGLNQPRS